MCSNQVYWDVYRKAILGIYNRFNMEKWNIAVVFTYILHIKADLWCLCMLDRVVDNLSVPEMETVHVDKNFKGYFIIKYQ